MSDSVEPETRTESATGAATGLFGSLKSLLATFLALIHTRVELLTTELREEVQRAAALFVWAFIALLAVMIGLFFGGLTIVLVYWDTHRILAASLVTAAFLVVAVLVIAVLAAKMNSRPRFLDATLTELGKDANSLKRDASR